MASRKFRRILIYTFLLLAVLGLAGGGVAALALYAYFSRDLPDHQQLAKYEPATLTRVHAGDGRILAEFAAERRLFVPIDAIPKRVVDAFLSAEDKSFYAHSGVSLPDILRAAITNAINMAMGDNKRPIGASTITQQVAKNFLLGNEVSIQRKAREAILALRIEEVLPKDRILELYLNEIYLGVGAYGVAAAALVYFDKSLDELTVAEAAYLASLPKAPNNYHPTRFPDAAKGRRDWAVGRMLEDGKITEAEAAAARAAPLGARMRGQADTVRADYFAEEVRRELIARFGEPQVYRGGMSVRTTLDPALQEQVDRALQSGLVAYDRRHGWRGALAKIETGTGWEQRLAAIKPAGVPAGWRPALVLATAAAGAEIGFADGARGAIPFAEMQWARATKEDQKLGPAPRNAAEVVKAGDVVLVEALEGAKADAKPAPFALRQLPNVGGAVVALDPHTGRVLAMAGGWSFEQSQFNRATQALRQPGSAFKPFVYLPALDEGFTPATLILDAPIVVDRGPTQEPWKPGNFTDKFYGPSPMRTGIEQSRNLMTVRLAQHIGMDKVVATAQRFQIADKMLPVLPMALGSGETTVLRLTTAYAMLVNGGLQIVPTLIDRVDDRNGKTIFRHDTRPCERCQGVAWTGAETPPPIPDMRPRVVSAQTAYQMVSMLQGVVERGTARRLKELGRPLAGKTGTTNDVNDAWFVGFSPDLVMGVFVGFDQPRTLGGQETGGSVAVPIFREAIAEALKGKPAIPFRVPPGIRMVRVNPSTGQLARAGEREAIWEAFKPGTERTLSDRVLEGTFAELPAALAVPAGEGGGLY